MFNAVKNVRKKVCMNVLKHTGKLSIKINQKFTQETDKLFLVSSTIGWYLYCTSGVDNVILQHFEKFNFVKMLVCYIFQYNTHI